MSPLSKRTLLACFLLWCSIRPVVLALSARSKTVVENGFRVWTWRPRQQRRSAAGAAESGQEVDPLTLALVFNNTCMAERHTDPFESLSALKKIIGECVTPKHVIPDANAAKQWQKRMELRKSRGAFSDTYQQQNSRQRMYGTNSQFDQLAEWRAAVDSIAFFKVTDGQCLIDRTANGGVTLDHLCISAIGDDPLYALDSLSDVSTQKINDAMNATHHMNDRFNQRTAPGIKEASMNGSIFNGNGGEVQDRRRLQVPSNDGGSKRQSSNAHRVKCKKQATDSNYPYLPAWFKDAIDGTMDGSFNGFKLSPNEDPLVDIYMLDTGVLCSHVEFEDTHCEAIDELTQTEELTRSHGTFTASVAVGKFYGVAHGFPLYSYNVCRRKSEFQVRCQMSDIIAGLLQVYQRLLETERRAVVNLSFGAAANRFNDDGTVNPLILYLESLILDMEEAGAIVVTSSGNENMDACQMAPGFSDYVVTVGSFDQNWRKVYSSNYGQCVDTFAPGQFISGASDFSDSAYVVKSGSSAAAPIVSGMIAWMLSINNALTRSQVLSILKPQLSNLLDFKYVSQCHTGGEPLCVAPALPCDDSDGLLSLAYACTAIEHKVPHTTRPTPTATGRTTTQATTTTIESSTRTTTLSTMPSTTTATTTTSTQAMAAATAEWGCGGNRSFCQYLDSTLCQVYQSAGFCEWLPES